MPRLIYWNVEHFSQDKFFTRKRKRSRDDDDEYGVNRGDELRQFLLATITANDPTFIVIVEVRPGTIAGAPGSPVDDQGTYSLLVQIRAVTGVNAWHLVPPLILGRNHKAEGIAVFFRSDRYFFTGPWRFPGGGGVAGRPNAIGAGGFYPAPWKKNGPAAPRGALPLTTVPNVVGARPAANRGVRQDRLAGRWRFSGTAHNVHGRLRFPGPGNDFRTPFLTTFYDAANDENLSLFVFHAPPDQLVGGLVNQAESVKGTRRLSFINQLQAIANNEIQIVVGDFNISVFDALATARGYGPLTAGPGGSPAFTQLINPTANANFPDRGYVSTHIKGIGTFAFPNATPWDTNGYPGFGYATVADQYGTYDSIDNAFVRYGAGWAPPAAHNTTIANGVTGSPYTAIPAPGGAPTGVYAYPVALNDATTLNSPVGINPAAPNAHDILADFIEPDNYALIRQTSDHLPLIFDY